MIIKVKTKKELLEYLKTNNKIVIDFYAEWCQPCQMQGVILDQVAKINSNYQFLKVDTTSLDGTTLSMFHIVSIPTIIIFNNQREITRFIGLTNKHDLIKTLK